MVPVVDVFLDSLHQFQFLFGIIDECAQLLLLAFADGVAEYLAYLTLDVARGIFQHVQKSLALTVEVGQEMLRPFGQVQYGLQVDNLLGRVGYRRKRLRQKVQVVHVG